MHNTPKNPEAWNNCMPGGGVPVNQEFPLEQYGGEGEELRAPGGPCNYPPCGGGPVAPTGGGPCNRPPCGGGPVAPTGGGPCNRPPCGEVPVVPVEESNTGGGPGPNCQNTRGCSGNCISQWLKGCFYLPNLYCVIESRICNEGIKYIFRQGRWQAILKYTIWLKYINRCNKICWAQRRGCLILADIPNGPRAFDNYCVHICQPPIIKKCGNMLKVCARVLFCRR